MTEERWRRIEALYHAVCEEDTAGRVALLDAECRDDSDLRRAVESLLAQGFRKGILDASVSTLTEGMSLTVSPGDKLGPYEIVRSIGKGGMGEVYKARDSRVGRTVAIKISKAQFSGQFEREARAIAALNHPHICTLYDVGPNYLVMEYVEGKTPRGPMPSSDARKLAVQLLDALEAAHSIGIVHRDLKPANILVAKSGIKVLDFGLAKMIAGTDIPPDSVSSAGAIQGTLRYMSPEQLQGKPVDGRSDLFSFGVVLHELLTGCRAFDADNPASIVAAIQERSPGHLDKIASAGLRRIVQRCLEKDKTDRWQTASDLKVALEWLQFEETPAPVISKRNWGRVYWLAAALLAIGSAAGWLAGIRSAREPQTPLEFSMSPPEGTSFADPAVGPVGYLSPDGRVLLGVIWNREGQRIWLRRLDSQTFVPMAGTEGAVAKSVAWSPDSKSFGLVTPEHKLISVPVTGGPPRVLAEGISIRGISWGDADTLIATDEKTERLVAIPASGGNRRLLGELDPSRNEIRHSAPQFLPGGKKYLYLARSSDGARNATYASSLDDPSARVLVLGAVGPAVFLPSREQQTRGWLFTGLQGRLYARQFDSSSLRVSNEAIDVTDRVDWGNNQESVSISGSRTGMLAINPSVRLDASPSFWTRDGQSVSPAMQPGAYFTPSFSHDGKRVALALRPPGALNQNIWVYESATSTMTRVTSSDLWEAFPVWSPDDRNLYFVKVEGRTDERALYRQDVDRLHPPVRVGPPYFLSSPCALSPDGRTLLFSRTQEQKPLVRFMSIFALALDTPQNSHPLLNSDERVVFAQFSPDGKAIVFSSNIDGSDEIYIQTYQAAQSHRWRVSSQGGTQPRWTSLGKEIVYLGTDGKLVSVPVQMKGAELELGKPRTLFAYPPLLGTISAYQFDVSPDGDRFVFLSAPPGRQAPPLRIILNWESLLYR